MTAIRATQCTGTSVRSGNRCLRLATLGATVCCMHGARAPQVRAAAQRRVTLAEALAHGDRRDPLQIMSDAMHTADVRARMMLEHLGNDVSASMIEQFIEATKMQAAMAKLALDTGVDPAGFQVWKNHVAGAFARVINDTLDALGVDRTKAAVGPALEAAVHAEMARIAAGPPVRGVARSPRLLPTTSDDERRRAS